ncbi:MAG: carboxypeptidase-like regulatory domain-containing protein [Flavobacteriaceae bacterium]|nr:carboxypeptidase-like regulatory domain-containing protein [Flavobacteriaceae bacterium]
MECQIQPNDIADGVIRGMVVDASTNETDRLCYNRLFIMPPIKVLHGAISSDKGAFEIAKIPEGKYRVEIQFIGYDNYTRMIDVKPGNEILDLGIISLTNVGQNLEEVLIKADKPVYVQKVDRTVINVQSSILSAGSTAMDILERSPGITVNRQNSSISLLGKDGVMVMLNGKISYMPQASIVQLLEGMSSDNIETIELITTPPANMDAAGNAGFIKIAMTRPTFGVNGSYLFYPGATGNGTTTQDKISILITEKIN